MLIFSSPEKINRAGEKKLLPAFRRAVRKMPAYGKILSEKNVIFDQIKNENDFRRMVPIIEKIDIFSRFDVEDFSVRGSVEKMISAMTSSGFSGVYSFGLTNRKNIKNSVRLADVVLDYTFDISHKKTLLINCLPMGVRVFTSLKTVDTSVRDDMVLAVLEKISPKFEQTLIIGDPHFLKKVAEAGKEKKINWKKLKISLILGGDWFSESFRSYLAGLIDLDFNNPDGRLIATTMGVAELDLNLFHESLQTILIRRKAQEDVKFREALFGKDVKAVPIFMHYYPHRIFLESLPKNSRNGELVFSMLNMDSTVPLMRYNSGDRGQIFAFDKIKKLLTDVGYENFIPELKLPMVSVAGRKDRYLKVEKEKKIYPEEIKQGLYENFDVAFQITGYFRLTDSHGQKKLEIQLKKGLFLNEELKRKIEKSAFRYTETTIPVEIYEYQRFPYGMELDYERKFINV